ncbi:hypothetical protein AWH48_03000 [Domibacillus aminovorans]|uniref:WYL domain-containing protein n=2 Tax=Bacillales TaxID=1385 RepID=A0A177KX69_9BACI|nr:hypothetical protein AWH48_03000 [Domibacillus aminovorans]
MPIEIIYMGADNTITKRRIIRTSMDDNFIKAYCFIGNWKRTFKLETILAAAKPRERKVVKYT